ARWCDAARKYSSSRSQPYRPRNTAPTTPGRSAAPAPTQTVVLADVRRSGSGRTVPVNELQHGVDGKRLRDVSRGTSGGEAFGFGWGVVAADDDDRDSARCRVGQDRTQHLLPGAVGQVHVEED